jgi:hypothetical protein
MMNPRTKEKLPLQLTILSIIISLTGVILISILVVFFHDYLTHISITNQKIELLELSSDLKQNHIYRQSAV